MLADLHHEHAPSVPQTPPLPYLIPLVPAPRYTPMAALTSIARAAGPLWSWWVILVCLGPQGQMTHLAVLTHGPSMSHVHRLKPRVVITAGQQAEASEIVLVEHVDVPPSPLAITALEAFSELTMQIAVLAPDYGFTLRDSLFVDDEKVQSLRTSARLPITLGLCGATAALKKVHLGV